MSEQILNSEQMRPTEWIIQDHIDNAFRNFLGDELPYRVRVDKVENSFVAVVTIASSPPRGVDRLVTYLELSLSREGYAVDIVIEHGSVNPTRLEDFSEAKNAFDRVWRRIEDLGPSAVGNGTRVQPPVREFIYLDIERLSSLFAQSRRGLTTFVNLQERGAQGGRNEQAGIAGSSSFEAEKLRGEMSVLHDYMYHLVEMELGAQIETVELERLRESHYVASLKSSRLCRVAGIAQIHDYSRMTQLVAHFNQVSEAIAYSIMKSPDAAQAIEALQKIAQTAKGQEREQAKKNLQKVTDTKRIAKELGLYQDETLLQNIKLFSDLFMNNAFEILIDPSGDSSCPRFRALLNKEYLRLPPDRLRMLYGTVTQDPWTLVGSVTLVTGSERRDNEMSQHGKGFSGATAASSQSAGSPFSMRPAFNGMFEGLKAIEEAFVASCDRPEVNVFPLAIYRTLRE